MNNVVNWLKNAVGLISVSDLLVIDPRFFDVVHEVEKSSNTSIVGTEKSINRLKEQLAEYEVTRKQQTYRMNVAKKFKKMAGKHA